MWFGCATGHEHKVVVCRFYCLEASPNGLSLNVLLVKVYDLIEFLLKG